MKKFVLFSLLVSLFFISCTKTIELELSEIERINSGMSAEIILNTQYKPWEGQEFVEGKNGGIWNDTILDDPKTFNQLIAERDGASSAIINYTLDYLFDYDSYNREWKPRVCSFNIETNEEKNILIVHCKIRDDAYWSYMDSDVQIPVKSDDFVFWYNEIEGDPESGSGGYGSQWVIMADGSEAHVDCIKVDDKNFDFVFPRIVADPLLSCNMNASPSFLLKEAKKANGMEGIKNLFPVNCDPKTIPSCGKFFISEYTPGQRLVFTKNPNHWEKDKSGKVITYYDKMIYQIVGDQNTDYLLFKQGKTETFTPRPEEVDDLVKNQKEDYTVFRAEGAMGASMWSFNQNPQNKDKAFYDWFTKKEFRQAMSCLLNRDRIINQTYRGLADPKYSFFPEVNPYYNPDIELKYKYSLEEAEKLLSSIGYKKANDGFMYDDKNRKIEFDISVPSSNTIFNDIGQIVVDECGKLGITVNIRQTDFQKLVEMLTATFDWESVFIGLGSNLFPSQGSNVWPSNGNLHLWYPCQKSPATRWEERVDYLYNEGKFTIEYDEAKKIWDEYQEILLEQCPVIYLLRSRSFFAIRNKWNLTNVYYDNRNGTTIDNIYLN